MDPLTFPPVAAKESMSAAIPPHSHKHDLAAFSDSLDSTCFKFKCYLIMIVYLDLSLGECKTLLFKITHK